MGGNKVARNAVETALFIWAVPVALWIAGIGWISAATATGIGPVGWVLGLWGVVAEAAASVGSVMVVIDTCS